MRTKYALVLFAIVLLSSSGLAFGQDSLDSHMDNMVDIKETSPVELKKVKYYCDDKLIGVVDVDISIISLSGSATVSPALAKRIADCPGKLSRIVE